jgi:hypothetical protein
VKSKYSIDEFIGVFDGYFGDNLCDRYVDHFKTLEESNLTVPREGKPKHEISDESVTLVKTNFLNRSSSPINYILKDFSDVFWNRCVPLYSKEYSLLDIMSYHTIVEAKIQKSSEGDGYHIWHCENEGAAPHRNRLLVFSLYLNDGYEGGETEFLFQKKRMKPQKDRLLIWPAQFTHTHRGNTVLKGDKYLLTGWVEFSNQWIEA